MMAQLRYGWIPMQTERMQVQVIPVLHDNYNFLLSSGEANAVVDPSEAEPIIKALRGRNLDFIFITHHHYDHIGGIKELKEKYNCQVFAGKKDLHRIPLVDRGLEEGDKISLGPSEAVIWDVPGHTTGHILYYFGDEHALFCGDTVFSIGCGRLFEGTPEQMWQSLSRIRALPVDTKIYCAHEYTLENGDYAKLAEPGNQFLLQYLERVRKLRSLRRPSIPALLKDELKCNPFLRPESREIQERVALVGETDFAKIFGAIRADKDSWDNR